jgi:hypothetical protein
MSAADWQLPMFKEEPTEEKPQPELITVDGDTTTTVTQIAKPTATSPNGATNLGDVLTRTVADTEAPLIVLDIDAKDYTDAGLTKAFKKAAGKAGWTDLQISTFHALLNQKDTIEDKIALLRPHTIGAQ